MKGTRISDKTYELIKGMLIQGYSVKKIVQMLLAEIAVSGETVRKCGRSANYQEYCGIKPEPKPEKVIQITPHAQSKEIVDAINATNEKLDRIGALLASLIESLT